MADFFADVPFEDIPIEAPTEDSVFGTTCDCGGLVVVGTVRDHREGKIPNSGKCLKCGEPVSFLDLKKLLEQFDD